MIIRSWIIKATLLALGSGMLITGASMLRAVQVRRQMECQGVVPRDGSRIYRERIRATERMLRGQETVEVSWGR
ncbi:MAG: hypothetical protein R6X14_04135 [bacterium]